MPLHQHDTHNYGIVDYLAQTPATMLILGVIGNCLVQHKSLLYSLGAIDPFNSCLMTFDLNHMEA